jgi:Response regulator containing a CheY-like receiver domain and an HTH DNA-binding domain
MLHAVLAAYILCFAGGVTLVVVASFASQRLTLLSFRDFALLFAAATLIMLVEAVKTYERVLHADFGPGLHVMGTVASVIGNAGMCWYLISLALQVVRIKPPRARIAAHAGLAGVLGILGGLKEAAQLLWMQPGPAVLLWNLDYLALLGIHVYAATILLRGFKRIESPWLQSLIRSFLVFFFVFAFLAVGQFVLQNIPTSPEFLHDYPIDELLYYLGFVILAVFYISRYFTEPARGAAFNLPEEFVRRFGISHRERDIIEMMAKGFSNNAIAEGLYISTLTVKNHVYHIYQKTGAGNKVQLLNMINLSK